MGTQGVLNGYSMGTQGVLMGYPRGTHLYTGLCKGLYSKGTQGVLTGYSRGTQSVVTASAPRRLAGLAPPAAARTAPQSEQAQGCTRRRPDALAPARSMQHMRAHIVAHPQVSPGAAGPAGPRPIRTHAHAHARTHARTRPRARTRARAHTHAHTTRGPATGSPPKGIARHAAPTGRGCQWAQPSAHRSSQGSLKLLSVGGSAHGHAPRSTARRRRPTLRRGPSPSLGTLRIAAEPQYVRRVLWTIYRSAAGYCRVLSVHSYRGPRRSSYCRLPRHARARATRSMHARHACTTKLQEPHSCPMQARVSRWRTRLKSAWSCTNVLSVAFDPFFASDSCTSA
jgi:hypothetical protein